MVYGNSSNQDCKALQRVVRLAERISGSALPSLQDIYHKRCKSRAAKILKDSTHPGNHLFCLLPSGKRFRSMMAKTERLRRSFFPQAIRLLNTNPVSETFTRLIINCKTFIFSSSVLLLCVHTRYNPFAHPSCTSLLFILLFIKSQYTVFAHLICFALFTLYFSFFTYIPVYALVLCYFYIIFILLHCPLSGPDLEIHTALQDIFKCTMPFNSKILFFGYIPHEWFKRDTFLI